MNTKHSPSKSTKDSLLLYKRPYAGAGNISETPQFIIRVNTSDFQEWKKNPTGIPIVEVVDAWEIYVSRTNRSHLGNLERPSQAELQEAFGTTSFEDIFRFMAQHGNLQHAGRQATLENHTKGVYKGHSAHSVTSENISSSMHRG